MDGKSRRGRPCREWLDDITEWCQRSGHDLFHLAQDRRGAAEFLPRIIQNSIRTAEFYFEYKLNNRILQQLVQNSISKIVF